MSFANFISGLDNRLVCTLAKVALRKVGNSYVISVPLQVRKYLNLEEKDKVKIVKSGNKVYLEKEGA